jgi:hypothetical protein
MNQRTDIRLSLPSKGRLGQASLDFLAACGLPVEKPNPRQYAGSARGAGGTEDEMPLPDDERTRE